MVVLVVLANTDDADDLTGVVGLRRPPLPPLLLIKLVVVVVVVGLLIWFFDVTLLVLSLVFRLLLPPSLLLFWSMLSAELVITDDEGIPVDIDATLAAVVVALMLVVVVVVVEEEDRGSMLLPRTKATGVVIELAATVAAAAAAVPVIPTLLKSAVIRRDGPTLGETLPPCDELREGCALKGGGEGERRGSLVPLPPPLLISLPLSSLAVTPATTTRSAAAAVPALAVNGWMSGTIIVCKDFKNKDKPANKASQNRWVSV